MSETGLDIETIYQYDKHKNIPWNIVQYQPLREYLDHRQNNQDEKNEQPKDIYVTKRGHYLDYHLKVVKDLPAPCKYDFPSQFDQTLNIKQSAKHKIDFKLRKNSYLEQIQSKAKRYKSPAVGQYHFQQQKQKSHKKLIKNDQKRFFYQDSEFLSTAVPGSGCYYPHDDIPVIRKERTNHKFWIDKHHKEGQKNRKRKLKEPDPGTYRPLSATFNSFDKMKVDNEKRKKKQSKKKPLHGFYSSDTKFEYNRTKKSKVEPSPDPCHYNTMIEWKGKGLDPKKNNWVRCLSARPSSSVYH